MQRNIKRTIFKTIITVVILLVLFVGAGVAYVYFTGGSTPKNDTQTNQPQVENFKPLTPRKPSPNAPESAAVESLLSPVSAGANTTIIVKTVATSNCTIDVKYNNVPSKDSGLIPKVADDFGNVTWTWTVDKTAPLGTWPVKVTCVYHGRTGVVQGDLQVVK